MPAREESSWASVWISRFAFRAISSSCPSAEASRLRGAALEGASGDP